MSKRSVRIMVVWMFVVGVCLLNAPQPALAETIKLATEAYCPYVCDPETEGVEGYMMDVAHAIFEEKGYTVEYYLAPWSRAILWVREGTFDGLVGCFQEHLPGGIFHENELGINVAKYYVKKGNLWTYQGADSLDNIVLGTVRDYTYSEDMEAYMQAHPENVRAMAGDDALQLNLKNILLDRIDATNDNALVVEYTIKKMGLSDQIVEAGTDGKVEFLYLGFSPKNPKSSEYAKILAEGIAELRASGRLQEILGKYGLKDWQ